MEKIKVEAGYTLGRIASSRGLKGEAKAKFISSVMELNGIKDERLLQIGMLKLPDNSVFDQEAQAFAELEKSEGPAKPDESTEKAPKPTIGEKFANWADGVSSKSVNAQNKAVRDIKAYDKENPDADPAYREARINNAHIEVATTRNNLKGFTFTDKAFEKALAEGDEEKAKKLYVQGLTSLSRSYIQEVDPEGNGSISQSAFIAHDMAYTAKAGLKYDKVKSERVFKRSDLNGDGKISLAEQRSMFALMDYNSETGNNGIISFKDYANVRNRLIDETDFGAIRGELKEMDKFLTAKPKAKEEPISKDERVG